tara:strand:- start:2828 stop:4114 length:1287 start_codon:yes stop_codon:yes gene_type:complete
MGIYSSFIQEMVKSVKYRGANFIQYADSGGELYISFQTLLKFIAEYITLVDQNDQAIVKIDWESDKPFFAYSTSISCNLLKCYLYNDYVGNEDGAFYQDDSATFHPFTFFEDQSLKNLNTELGKEAAAPNYSIFPVVGNINYVYLNVGFLSELLTKGSDNAQNLVSVREFLQEVCNGVNKALGSINDFQVIIDDDTNTLTVVDFNQKRIKGLTDIKKGMITTLKAQGLGSFVISINAQSSITPDIAATIAIGAQANANQLGVEAITFSRLSKGIVDRIYTERKPKNAPNVNNIDLEKEKNEQFQTAVEAYIQLIANQIPSDNTSEKILYKSDDDINLENIPVELYKALLGKFTESKQASTTFIPIKLELVLSGISGIKIFDRFTITSDVLPYIYNQNFDFIVTGVSHEITNNNRWLTKLSAIITLKEE